MNNADLAVLLENNFLAYVRTSSIFFVAGIALFNFTNLGKNFSIVSLIVALLLLSTIATDYFVERYRIAQLGFYPRTVVDIMALSLIALICLLIWIIYTVWGSSQVSLTDLAKEVEKEIDLTNQQLIENVKELEDKIVNVNKNLIEVIRNPNYVPQYETSVPLTDRIKANHQKSSLNLHKLAQRQVNTINNAALAAVV